MEEEVNFSKIIEVAQHAVGAQEVKGTHFVVVPPEHDVHSLDALIEKAAEYPKRISTNHLFIEPKSFTDYFKEFQKPNSRIFAQEAHRYFRAIMDYHDAKSGPEQARWCEQRASLQLQHTVEWLAWSEKFEKWLDQESFADFLERHIMDVSYPDAAELLETAMALEETRTMTVKSHARLQDGQFSIGFAETTGEPAKITNQININIEVFYGSGFEVIPLKLRYRVREGKITFCIFPATPVQNILRQAFSRMVEQIQAETGQTVWMGQVTAQS